MKRTICIALLSATLLTSSLPVFAEEVTQDSDPQTVQTTISATVSPTYIVAIPADTDITFNSLSTEFGAVTLTSATLAPDCAVVVTAEAGALANDADSTKTIPYTVMAGDTQYTTCEYTQEGESKELTIDIAQSDWDSAYAGTYTGTVTFTVEYTGTAN